MEQTDEHNKRNATLKSCQVQTLIK